MKWLMMATVLLTFPVAAQTFDNMWQDRVGIAILPAAQPFDEQQFSDEVAKKNNTAKANKEKSKEREDRSCLTLRQARRKYPGHNLAWHDDHCWYARKHHHH